MPDTHRLLAMLLTLPGWAVESQFGIKVLADYQQAMAAIDKQEAEALATDRERLLILIDRCRTEAVKAGEYERAYALDSWGEMVRKDLRVALDAIPTSAAGTTVESPTRQP
jgi:hypothetical protein